MTLRDGVVQRRVTVIIPHVDIDVCVCEKQLHRRRVALAACPYQRRGTVISLRVDIDGGADEAAAAAAAAGATAGQNQRHG